MHHSTALERLTRRLNLIGLGLLLAGAAAFVWAVGFTRGVEGLIEGLIIAGMGLFVPGVATLWVSWIIGSASGDEQLSEPVAEAPRRARFARRLRNYTIAVLLVVVAASVRTWLTPWLGHLAPFPTFLLAIAVAAWVGGMGPGAFATALALPVVWALFIEPATSAHPAGELVAAGLFAATGLSVAGVTAALRATQARVDAFRVEIASRQTTIDEAEVRFQQLADRSAKLIRVSDARRQCTYFNQAWCAFTGRTPEQELGDGWVAAVHPEDRERCVTQFAKAHEERDPFTLEYRLRRHDGVYRRVLDHGRPRVAGDGRFAGFVSECEDVTDLPLALRRLAHSATAVAAAPRNEAGTVE